MNLLVEEHCPVFKHEAFAKIGSSSSQNLSEKTNQELAKVQKLNMEATVLNLPIFMDASSHKHIHMEKPLKRPCNFGTPGLGNYPTQGIHTNYKEGFTNHKATEIKILLIPLRPPGIFQLLKLW